MSSKRNWTYLIAITITRGFMLGAAVVSFTHIVTTAHMLGIHGVQAWTTPFAIDGFAALGMLGRSHRFAESTRRVGLRFAVAAGTLSLAANVYAGTTLGERLYGALVVAAFVAAEQYADRMRPAEADTTEDLELVAARAALAAAQEAAAAASARADTAEQTVAAMQADAARAARAAKRRERAEARAAADTARRTEELATVAAREQLWTPQPGHVPTYAAAAALAERSPAPVSPAPYGA